MTGSRMWMAIAIWMLTGSGMSPEKMRSWVVVTCFMWASWWQRRELSLSPAQMQ